MRPRCAALVTIGALGGFRERGARGQLGPRTLAVRTVSSSTRPGRRHARNVGGLQVKWTFHAGGPVTASPSIVTLDLPGEGRTQVAFIAGMTTSTRFELATAALSGTSPMPDQPGAAFPYAGPPTCETDRRSPARLHRGRRDRSTPSTRHRPEVWHFDAGTGCATPPGDVRFPRSAPNERDRVVAHRRGRRGSLRHGHQRERLSTGRVASTGSTSTTATCSGTSTWRRARRARRCPATTCGASMAITRGRSRAARGLPRHPSGL